MTGTDPFRLGVLGVGAVLVTVIGVVRFCGGVTIPPKPPAPQVGGTQQDRLAQTAHSPTAYLEQIRSDAAAASVVAPSLEDMSRKFAYRGEETTRTLAPGDPPIDVAGLRIHLERTNDEVVLIAENLTPSDVAYNIVTSSPLGPACNSARALPFDAMIVRKGGTETRTECKDSSTEAQVLKLLKVETIALPPLSSYYVDQLPPALVGIDPRIARGHQAGHAACSENVSQAVRSGMEHHEITWRDLVDFYARHNCANYQFPMGYRAFTEDGERPIPAVDGAR